MVVAVVVQVLNHKSLSCGPLNVKRTTRHPTAHMGHIFQTEIMIESVPRAHLELYR